MSAFDDAVAQCAAQKLGTSACLDHIDPFCIGNPEAVFDPSTGKIVFKCAQPLSPEKAAALLKETQQRIAAADNARADAVPLVIVGGLVVLGVVVWLATR